jgi:hydrogenase maturation protease
MIEPHAMHPLKVLQMVKSMGGEVKRLLVVGCEPGTCGPDEPPQMGLSEPVQAAVDEAVKVIESLVMEFLREPAERVPR